MICSSEKRFFTSNLLTEWGLDSRSARYSKPGGRRQRPGELRQAEWREFDLEDGEWTIPKARTKTKRADHLVPLSRQAIEVLLELQPVTGRGRYVFPGARDRTRRMSDNAVNAALRHIGFDKDVVTGRGFRATTRTILDEELGFRPDIIEHQLAHAVKEPKRPGLQSHLAPRTSHLAPLTSPSDA